MTDVQPLSSAWKERLGLASRRAPEFYETSDAVEDTPHALAIRTSLDGLGLSGVFCVQGVPTIAILNVAQYAVVRRICYFVLYQHEPFGTHPGGAKFSKGKIDIAVVLDQERERYVAYECKRLNVVHGGSRSSLATPYVMQGMMRFLTEQYAAALPVGCMLGYVMDCDLPFSLKQVAAAIEVHKLPLALTAGATQPPSITGIERFSTLHARASQSQVELRHVLLPFQAVAVASPAPGAASGRSEASNPGHMP